MNPWLEAKNILAIRLDNLGDVVMLGPALRAVKATSPRARITLLASPGGSAASSLLPWVDDVIVYRPVWQDVHHRIPLDPRRERDFAAMLESRSFDAALVFTSFSQTPHVPGYVCYLAGIPLRVGESKEFAGGVLTSELKGAPDDMHQVERNLRLVESVGFTSVDGALAVDVSHDARGTVPGLLVRAGLDPTRPFLLLHPGASAEARRYPPQRFGVVARLLAELGHQVLLTGVDREAEMLAAMALEAGVACLVGSTDLMEYAALVEAASLVVCGNTLPMHLADALRTPLVVLYSGTDLEDQWRPRSTPAVLLRRQTACSPCYLFRCPIGQPCLDIDPVEVVREAEAMLARTAEMVEEVR